MANATIDYARPIHAQRHSPGGADDPFGGVRLVSYPLTLSAATSVNDTATSVHERWPIKTPAHTRRWRIHIRNYNDRGSSAYTGALAVTGIWFGQHSLAADGALTGNFIAATKVVDAFSTDAAGAEWVSPWMVADSLQMSRGVEYLLSLGYTCAAQTNQCGIGGGWRSTHPEDAGSATPGNALSAAIQMPLDVWLECEISAQVPILGHGAGDSLLCGTNSTVPIRDGYAMKHAHAHGVWPLILANHGSSMTDWTSTGQWKWQKYAALSKPDAILSEIGSNDIFNSADLATCQSRFATYVAALRAFWGTKPLYLRTILPRNGANTDSTRDGVRVSFNNWLYTLPGAAHGVYAFDEAVKDATATNPENVDTRWISGDGIHLNSAGYARSGIVISGPIAVTHVRPASAVANNDTTPPAPATGLSATLNGATRVDLAWLNPSDADFYGIIICRTVGPVPSTSPNSGQISASGPGITSFSDTTVLGNQQYSYSVFTRDRAGNINPTPATATVSTPVDTVAPGPISGLVVDADQAQVAFAWTNPADGDFDHVVIRRAAGATPPATPTSGTAIASTTGSSVHAYTDATAAAATQYSYALFAVDSAGNVSTAVTKTLTTPETVLVGYTMRLWADSLVANAGDSLTTWRSVDGSGTSFTVAAAPASATAPTVQDDTTQTTVMRSVLFDGVNNGLGVALARSQPYTIAMVMRMAAGYGGGGSGVHVLAGGGGGAGTRGSIYIDGATGKIAGNAGSTALANLIPADNHWHVVIVTFNGAASAIRLDGSEVTGLNAGTENATVLYLGQYPFAGSAANVEFKEVLYYPTALTATDRGTVRTQLKAAYSVLP